MAAHKNCSKISIKPKRKSTTLKFLLDLDSNNNPDHEQILSLISHSSSIFTFTDPSESPFEQNRKRDSLTKLFSVVKKAPPNEILSSLFDMISINLFRSLPPSKTSVVATTLPEDDDDDIISTPIAAWPHRYLVYDILLQLVVNFQSETLCHYIDDTFILNLLALFQSEDPRERRSLKNVYHKIYSKLHPLRSFMRKAMSDAFLHYIFGDEQCHCGIGEMLDIWGTIIDGFSVPLKEEHRIFLMRVLIPLHRPIRMAAYRKQLCYCLCKFVEKEGVLGVVVVRGILRYWPVTKNCQKEVLLIGVIEELVENMGTEQQKILALPLCRQITKCSNSWNSQVAERALNVWNNERFVKMALEAIDDVFLLIVEGVEKNLRRHWSRSVRELTENVKEMLEEMEPMRYSRCLSQLVYHDDEDAKHEEEMRRRERWERVEMVAKRYESVYPMCFQVNGK